MGTNDILFADQEPTENFLWVWSGGLLHAGGMPGYHKYVALYGVPDAGCKWRQVDRAGWLALHRQQCMSPRCKDCQEAK